VLEKRLLVEIKLVEHLPDYITFLKLAASLMVLAGFIFLAFCCEVMEYFCRNRKHFYYKLRKSCSHAMFRIIVAFNQIEEGFINVVSDFEQVIKSAM